VTFQQANIPFRDALDDFHKACVLAEGITVKLAHMRAIGDIPLNSPSKRDGQDLLFNHTQEPPVREVPDDGQRYDEFAAAYNGQPEPRGRSQDFWVV
jgi:hypothetical protein